MVLALVILELMQQSQASASDLDQFITRFNIILIPRLVIYLRWVRKTLRISRAVYLRSLIKKDMENNSEYQKHLTKNE